MSRRPTTFDEHGREVLDLRPVDAPTGLRAGLSLQDEIKRYVRAEISRRAADTGMETWEEANDFDIDEDELLDSAYTVRDMLPDGPRDASEHPPRPSISEEPTGAPASQPASK